MVAYKPDNDTLPVGSALAWAEAELLRAGIHPARREARWLLEHICGEDGLLPGRILTAEALRRYRDCVGRRARHYPLQYLLGSLDFAGVTLAVTPDALIPRPETEYLVERVLALLPGHAGLLTCADLGTGSGCLAIALSAALPLSRWHACDSSPAALNLAARNAVHNQVADRITWHQGSWFAAFDDSLVFDVIVSNPPYVAEGELLEPELEYEPACALYAGSDGMTAWREIIPALSKRLAPNGLFAGEIGLHQETALGHLARQAGCMSVDFEKDLSGRTRYIIIRQP